MNRDSIQLIDNLIKKYGNDAKQIILNGLGLDSKGTNHYRCPNVHAHKNNDATPSMGWVDNGHYFHCMACGESINIYTYLNKYLGHTFREIMQDENIEGFIDKRNDFVERKSKEIGKITKEQIDYCTKRGLTEQTIKRFKLSDAGGSIGMPYFTNGFVAGVKKKTIKGDGPKNLSITGSSFGLFNRDNTEFTSPLIIVEGEFDCMIVDQCGFKNVVSVGTGANAIKKVIELCRDFIERFPEVILFTDADKYGDELDDELTKEFKNVARVDKKLYMDQKDANDIYLKYGCAAIEKIIASAKFMVEGLIDANDFDYNEIKETKQGKFIPTGFPSIDKALNELRPGYTTLVTGRANDGKSTFVLQVIANAIEKESKVFWVSGEETRKDLYMNLMTLLIGNNSQAYDVKRENLDYIKIPKKLVFEKIKKWHDGRLQIFNKGESRLKTTVELLEMIRLMIKKNGFNLVVIDNLMSLLSSKASEKNEAQADFMQGLHDMAQSTGCHVILVLHPNKEYRKGEDLEFEMISGTSDLSNKADNIIFVRKAHDSEKEANGINGYVQVLKNRKKSMLPKIETNYDFETGMLAEIDKETKGVFKYKYSWDKKEMKIKEEFKQGDGPDWL